MPEPVAIRYRFIIESPYIGSDYETEVEYDSEPSEQDLLDDLEAIYANHFPGSWERVDAEDGRTEGATDG